MWHVDDAKLCGPVIWNCVIGGLMHDWHVALSAVGQPCEAKPFDKIHMDIHNMPFEVALAEYLSFCYQNAYFNLLSERKLVLL